jgi:hypothetical protein
MYCLKVLAFIDWVYLVFDIYKINLSSRPLIVKNYVDFEQ